MNDLRKAAEMALKALEHIDWEDQSLSQVEAKEALRQALAQPEQEPVAYTGNGTAGREADVRPTGFFFQMPKPIGEVYGWHGTGKGQPMCRFNASEEDMPVGTKLYTAPPKREWVGLTDDEIEQGLLRSDYALQTAHAWRSGVIFAMTKLKEKNNG